MADESAIAAKKLWVRLALCMMFKSLLLRNVPQPIFGLMALSEKNPRPFKMPQWRNWRDAADSKSATLETLWVRIPLAVPFYLICRIVQIRTKGKLH